MIDELLVILSVLIAFSAWERKVYFPIAMILVADFAFFFGFQEIWIKTDYIDLNQEVVYSLEGFAYLVFFYLYLITGGTTLAVLSALAGFYHFSLCYIGDDAYTLIMTIYCILQLSIAFMGVYNDFVRRHYPHYFSYFNHLFNSESHYKERK